MPTPIRKLKGLSVEVKEKLKEKSLLTAEQFLEAAATPAGRQELAKFAGVDHKAILELANRADLARVQGIGGVFGDLLESAGVDTVKELATRRPENLHAKLMEVNAEQKLAGRLPTPQQVADWVKQAKELPKVLEY